MVSYHVVIFDVWLQNPEINLAYRVPCSLYLKNDIALPCEMQNAFIWLQL